MLLPVMLFFVTFTVCESFPSRDVYTNHWAVRVPAGRRAADELAAKYGYRNLGQIGTLEDHYHFHHSRVVRRSPFSTRGNHSFIHMDPKVDWVQQQMVKRRVKRTAGSDLNVLTFNDPKWPSMWYIHCGDKSLRCRSEMNIMAAWQRGFTGKNVVVSILDDGIEKNHTDLAQNYDPLASFDINGNDHDPTPRYDPTNENKHGTRCAGEVAAVGNNSHCTVGIAHHARIGGIRMLDGDVTDLVEAKSLGVRPDYIDIYSASWGPDDDGMTVDGPGPLAKQAFELAVKKGRKGRGSIFVWASGNGGRRGDHCSCDGYTNSIYTISVSSTTESGTMPWYLEACASTLASTYSSGESYHRKIVTTDLRQRCTEGHTGTSVSAPIAAGVIALALEANPLLTWRDVQHLLVATSRPAHLKAHDWKTNAVGHKVSHLYGFGLLDAEGMVLEAQTWRTVPPQHTCMEASDRQTRHIWPDQRLSASVNTTGCAEQLDRQVAYLEHVVVRVTIAHPRRGDLQISLVSPSGTRSHLLAKRQFDNSKEGFRDWEFMTVHCWGEKAKGLWTLEITESPSRPRSPKHPGKLKEWTLILYGTSEHPYNSPSPLHPRGPESPSLEQQLEEPEEDEYDGPCHPECGEQGCYGPSADHCLNCIHFKLGRLRTGRTCVSHCPLGYFEDKAAQRCRRCTPGCERCVGRAPSECHACRRDLYLHADNNTCVTGCPLGYYADDVHRQCKKCHNNCRACRLYPERCTDCNDGYSLSGIMCVPKCASGMFFNLEEMECVPCHESCSSCNGPEREDCLQCAANFLEEEWMCVSTCSQGYYPDQTTGSLPAMCQKCEEQCLNCSGPGITCTRCREGYSLVGGACIINNSCNNADEIFCEMVKSNRLCEKKLFRQFCCKTCFVAG
ncbi:proprotein convertase subtilisin/kexin type 6-like isoform X2 [Scleropages formosus]|uniref:proprotein convertase subtilisin/kexin type 6-like isoform X2 n=1 Tax=Scleropages formosus TaxID=113540 RepID=UPI0010FACBA7|nr:proprotein convertase subtilisin/kexin type 6-like isoform X2 [Scleropages formosus]